MESIFDRLRDGVLTELIAKFSAIVPKLTAAILVLLVGYLVAKLVRSIVRRVLTTLKIDKLADSLNDIDMLQSSGVRIRPSVVVSNTLYYILMLLFTVAATDALGVPAITQLVSDLLNYMPALISAAFIFLLGLFFSDLIKGIVTTTCQSLGMSSAKMIGNIVFYIIFLTIGVSALAQAKIDTHFISSNITILIAAPAFAFALGYGIAARDLISNYLAGFYNKNKVHLGDDVQILGVRGKVVLIDQNSLILQTEDRAILVPLAKLTTEKVEIFYPDGQDDHLLQHG